MADIFAQVEQAAQLIMSRTDLRPKIALVLGSGLGSFADELADAARIRYEDIPFFAQSTAVGHPGILIVGKAADTPLFAMQGRFHLYEGYTAQQASFPIRVFSRLGAQAAILTNAAGGINPHYAQGGLVLMKDHINLQGQNPLVGAEEKGFDRFIDMTHAYDTGYRRMALESAKRVGIELSEGVYAGVLGPSYETPAEIRYLRAIGADMVGMSTIPEVIVARKAGMKVLGISCVANMAAGIIDQPISHGDVLQTANRVSVQLKAMLRELIPAIARELARR